MIDIDQLERLENLLSAARAAIAHLINNPFSEDCFDCKAAVAAMKGEK